MYIVYIHTNKINNKKYCGITNNIQRRWRHNGIAYKPYKGKLSSRRFWNAICIYSFNNFKHEVLFDDLTFEEACIKEIEIIKNLNLADEKYGYNMNLGGNGGIIYKDHPKGMLGKKHTETWRIEHSKAMTGENNPFYNKRHEFHPKGMLGKKHTEETRYKIGCFNRGKRFSIETREKIAIANKGKTLSSKTKNKISIANKGRFKGGKNPASIKVKVTFPNGIVTEYQCIEDLYNDLKISTTLYYKLRNLNTPYIPKGRSLNLYAHLKGILINTI
ncbi:NUMOD3 domain-containing DNA-binding protein [Clostridium chromiireducens]|uniref:NUMOD3 motif (2 copies) n=1 Tax=Clostridium chromiireducens TaxID=225345 RepID=A0A1V4J0R0_9CLOT|nr:NUMOD3 domain-containing DNA-binding protein [Clostridium chromiireducens]OPJ65743.1 NUMOD3 motif (2 copies) [Clostridium chromiireducens]